MADDFGLLRQATQDIEDTFNILSKDKEDRAYTQYMSMLQGVDDVTSIQPPGDVNYTGWNRAIVDTLDQRMMSGKYQQQRMAMLEKEISFKRQRLVETAQKAETLVQTNVEAALDTYMQMYSEHPNGVTVSKDPNTGMFNFKDEITGKEWSDDITIDDARMMIKKMLSPGEYEKVYLTDRTRVTEYNKIAAMHPDIMVDNEGREVAILTLIDPNTGGKVIKRIGPDGRMEDVDMDDILHGRYTMKEDALNERLKRLGVEKAELDVAGKRQAMRHADEKMGLIRKGKVGSDGAPVKSGAVNRDVAAIMSAYDVSEAEAMDIYRRDKTLNSRLKLAQAEISDALLDPEFPEDAKKIDAILKKYNVDQLPGTEGYGGERGKKINESKYTKQVPSPGQEPIEEVPGKKSKAWFTFNEPKDGVKIEQQPDPVIIQALQKQFPNAPDGTIKYARGKEKYVKVNGRWVREE